MSRLVPDRRPPGHCVRQCGFSIMEALVALTIIAIGLTAFTKAVSSSYRAAARVKLSVAALASARSHLDSVGQTGPLEDGVLTGNYANDLPWRLTVSALANATRPSATIARPFWVTVEAFDRRGVRLVKLQTAKLSTGTPP
jgi:prepilin-type N-terminal cleavage/methylation domain-containing protein